ncbi:hypothetical protein OPV22_025487 [Ensete ventricosum]|uniref:Secreted protein n=1 Tax=Ensete ventricosum TaxID=4639 RepID=A0AAV8QD54_ENSVE|nr:hypothetical protein OPV22_025487 [Ensete ventricosum]
MIASSPFSPWRALFFGCCSIRLPRDRAASAPYCCAVVLCLMKSDKPQTPSSGFGKLVLVKKVEREGTVTLLGCFRVQ